MKSRRWGPILMAAASVLASLAFAYSNEFGKISFDAVVIGNTFEGTAEGWIGEFEFRSVGGTLQGPNQLSVSLRSSRGASVGHLDLHR